MPCQSILWASIGLRPVFGDPVLCEWKPLTGPPPKEECHQEIQEHPVGSSREAHHLPPCDEYSKWVAVRQAKTSIGQVSALLRGDLPDDRPEGDETQHQKDHFRCGKDPMGRYCGRMPANGAPKSLDDC